MNKSRVETTIYQNVLHEKRDDKPDDLIASRIEAKWRVIEQSDVIPDDAALHKLSLWLKENGYPNWMRECSGSSLILQEDTQQISTGYAVIDEILGGIHHSDIIILGARVAMGKTAFALDIAYALATAANKKTAIFTSIDNVENISEGLKRRVNADSQENISLWAEDILSIKILRNRLDANPVDFLIIDCLQSFHQAEIRNAAQVETTMRELKQLAEDMNVPMLILTQLSRRVERRKVNIPKIKDIPKYKSVVPFADIILMLYREAYYVFNADRRKAWCFIEKNARGKLGAIPLRWDDDKLSFEFSAL